jgi:hypothetical protein
MLHLLLNEVLLEISASIQDNKSLICLELTHRCLSNIAYERLIRAATVSFHNIPGYIMLLTRHPQWANTITEIELQDNRKDIGDFSCTPRELKVIMDLISKLPQGQVRENARCVFKTNPQSPQLWSALLLAALPNAKALRFVPKTDYEDTCVNRSFLWDQAGMGFRKLVPLLQYSQSRVQTLTVRAPSDIDIHDPITFSHLMNLKTLVVDGECLHWANLFGCVTHGSAILERTGYLPDNLETLRVYGHERTMPWRWLFELQRYQGSGTFATPNIARLKFRLYFNIPCRTLARFLVYHFEPET